MKRKTRKNGSVIVYGMLFALFVSFLSVSMFILFSYSAMMHEREIAELSGRISLENGMYLVLGEYQDLEDPEVDYSAYSQLEIDARYWLKIVVTDENGGREIALECADRRDYTLYCTVSLSADGSYAIYGWRFEDD